MAETYNDHPNGIKFWAEEERPREKLLAHGRRHLTNAELLAIIIGSGTRNKSAVDVCKKILRAVDHRLTELAVFSPDELMKFEGIGLAKAVSIIAALELGNRKQMERKDVPKHIRSSAELFEVAAPLVKDLRHEEFWIFLTRGTTVIGRHMISKGGLRSTVVDPKVVFKTAIDARASGMFLVHNHPSGSPNPSDHDNKITRQLAEAAKLFDMVVYDHVIVAGDTYYSYADNTTLLKT